MRLRLTTAAAFAFALTAGMVMPSFAFADPTSDVNALATDNRVDRKVFLKSLSDAGMDAFDALVVGLTHEKASVREDCARLLGALGNAKAIEPLASRLVKVEGPKQPAKADTAAKPADPTIDDGALPEGAVREQHDDGTVVIIYADKTRKETRPDGTWTITKPDGTVEEGKTEKVVDGTNEADKVVADGGNVEPTAEEVAALKERLKTGEYADHVRAAAVTALGRIAEADAGSKERVAAILVPLLASSEAFTVRLEAANGLAALAMPAHADAMSAFLTPEGDPSLGMAAIRYFIARGADGQAKLLSFADKKMVGEGEAAKLVWAFDASPNKGWLQARTMAVMALARAKHPEGARLLVVEAEENSRTNSVAVSQFQLLARNYGESMAGPVLAMLKAEAKKNINHVSPAMEAGLALLAETGEAGVTGIVALMDEGEAEIKATPGTRNPFETLFSTALDNTRYGHSQAGLVRNEGTRKALIKVYASRPEPEGDAKDAVRNKIFDVLLQSRTPESRQVLIEAFGSKNVITANQAIEAWISTQPSDDVGPLEAILKHENADVRVTLATKLRDGRVPSTRATQLLIKMFADESPKVRKEIWVGLATSEDPAIFEEFERGMNDPSFEVQFAAASSFSTYLNRINTWEKDKKDMRRKATDTILKHLKAEGGAALILAEHLPNFNTSMWRNIKDGQEEVRDQVRKLTDSTHADIRGVASAQVWELYNTEWFERVRKNFVKETDGLAAQGQMQGLFGKLQEIKDRKADLEEMIEPSVKWLGFENAKNRAEQLKYISSNATQLLSTIANQGDDLKAKVMDRVRKLLQDELAAKKAGTYPKDESDATNERGNRVANALNVLSRLSSSADVPLAIDIMIAFDKPANARSYAQSFLQSHARKEHKARIEELDEAVLPKWQKQNIISRIDGRTD